MLVKEAVLPVENRQIKGTESFRLEYNPQTSERILQNDIVSYLGEYRFEVEKYDYKLFYTEGEDGFHIRGQEHGEALLEVGRRGIQDRQERGEVTNKVVADFLGMQQLEEKLGEAEDGDTIMYASPADPEIGYTYGFFYVGHVKTEGKEKRLEMTAIRLKKNQGLDRYNVVLELLTGANPQFSTVNEFIAHPQLVKKKLTSRDIDFVLKGVFDFSVDGKKQKMFGDIITTMQPYIKDFIHMIQSGAESDEQEKAFHALENYAIDLQKHYLDMQLVRENYRRDAFHYDKPFKEPANLGALVMTHGFEPPQKIGSCDGERSRGKKNKFGLPTGVDLYGAGSLFGADILKEFTSNFLEDNNKQEWFVCPKCGWEADGPIGDGPCGGCGLTKESWAKESGEKCD